MIIAHYERRVLVTVNGHAPFTQWLESLENTARYRVKTRLDRLKWGNFGGHKSVGDGVSELRLPFGPGYRIYYGIIDREIVMLLTGGDKAKQQRDIATAKHLCQSYLERDKK